MDHRAIVWCHGLLGQVRKILWIWTQEISQEEQRQRIIETLGTMSYEKDVTEMNGRLSVCVLLIYYIGIYFAFFSC